jgi:hypothetical protein
MVPAATHSGRSFIGQVRNGVDVPVSLRSSFSVLPLSAEMAVDGFAATLIGRLGQRASALLKPELDFGSRGIADARFFEQFIPRIGGGDLDEVLRPSRDGPAPIEYKKRRSHPAFHLAFEDCGDGKNVQIEINDPTIFVDFEFAKDKPFSCAARPPMPAYLRSAHQPNPAEQLWLGQLDNAPLDASSSFGEVFANNIPVKCP